MKIKTMLLTTIVTAGIAVSAQANDFVAADQSALTDVCMAALSGNRAAMHNSIKDSGYSRHFVVKNVECNGDNILAFVQENGKDSDNILRILDKSSTVTSITDLAKNNLTEK